jgi:hypothetical protein
MDEKRLQEIEGELECVPVNGYWHDAAADLIAEVRRLRGLIEIVEVTSGEASGVCSFCGEFRGAEGPKPHADDCPAFLPNGTVR